MIRLFKFKRKFRQLTERSRIMEENPKKPEKQYPFEYTLSIINGKWKIRIMYLLSVNKILRYGELKLEIPRITHKMLAKQLKEMETDGIIDRKEYSQIPPKVEYSLTEKGESLMPIVNAILSLIHI